MYNKQSVDSALGEYNKIYKITSNLQGKGWYRLCELATGVSGAVIELEITTQYYNQETSSKKIFISIGWTNHDIQVISCKDEQNITSQLRLNISGSGAARNVTIDMYYNYGINNGVFVRMLCKQTSVKTKNFEFISREVTNAIIVDITKTSLVNALADYMNVPLKNITLYSTVFKKNNLNYYLIGNVIKIIGSFTAKDLSAWSNAGSLPLNFPDNLYIKDINGEILFYVKTSGALQIAKNITADTNYYVDYSLPITITSALSLD